MDKIYAFRCTNTQMNLLTDICERNWLSRTTVFTTALMQYLKAMVEAGIIDAQGVNLDEALITDCQLIEESNEQSQEQVEYLDSPPPPQRHPRPYAYDDEGDELGLEAAEPERPYQKGRKKY